MTRKIEQSEDGAWATADSDVADELGQQAARFLNEDDAEATIPTVAPLNWRRIEEIREQRLLRAQLEDFEHYVI